MPMTAEFRSSQPMEGDVAGNAGPLTWTVVPVATPTGISPAARACVVAGLSLVVLIMLARRTSATTIREL